MNYIITDDDKIGLTRSLQIPKFVQKFNTVFSDHFQDAFNFQCVPMHNLLLHYICYYNLISLFGNLSVVSTNLRSIHLRAANDNNRIFWEIQPEKRGYIPVNVVGSDDTAVWNVQRTGLARYSLFTGQFKLNNMWHEYHFLYCWTVFFSVWPLGFLVFAALKSMKTTKTKLSTYNTSIRHETRITLYRRFKIT